MPKIFFAILKALFNALEEQAIKYIRTTAPSRFIKNGHQTKERHFCTSFGLFKYRLAQVRDKETNRIYTPLTKRLCIPPYRRCMEESGELGIGLAVLMSYRNSVKEVERIIGGIISKSTLHRSLQKFAETQCNIQSMRKIPYRFLMVDGTKVTLQNKDHLSRKAEMRWALASTGENEPFDIVDFWIDKSWPYIYKDLKKRIDYDKLEVLFSDGGPGIQENLLKRGMRHQRCIWHGKRDFPYILYADGLKKKEQEPFREKLKSIPGLGTFPNFKTAEYHPWDSISIAQDIRFVQCTGPFSLASGDTAKVVIAVVAGEDMSDFQSNSDVAQNLYDLSFETHKVTVLSPNGGEEVDSTVSITWADSSVTGNPLTVDISYSRDNGKTWNTIASGLEDTHEFTWNTLEVPDGTRYLIKVFVYDAVTIGADMSEDMFTVNNPGNGVPDVALVSPQRGTVEGVTSIEWEAADADHDSLFIDLSIRRRNSEEWIPISEGEKNTGSYLWNSYLFNNGDYRLRVVARDADTSSTDSSDGYIKILNDHSPAATVVHSRGGCNSLSIQALAYIPEDYTGHNYEIRFNLIQRSGFMDPLYTYDFYDVTIDSLLLSAKPLSTKLDGALYIDYSPIIDGFVLEFDSQVDYNSFRYVDFDIVTNVSGFDGNLEIDSPQPPRPKAWPFRGSDYELRWIKYPEDTTKVTLEVYDLTNDVFVPFGTGTGDSWYIGSGSDTLNSATDKRIHLCGGYFWFNRDGSMTVPPGPGDVWKIASSGPRAPCDGNVYTFTPVGIEEGPEIPSMCVLYQNIPNPFNSETVISYSVMAKEKVSLKVYDITGRVVRTLVNNIQNPGYYNIRWDGKGDKDERLASGIYFYRIEIGDFRSTKKAILLR